MKKREAGVKCSCFIFKIIYRHANCETCPAGVNQELMQILYVKIN